MIFLTDNTYLLNAGNAGMQIQYFLMQFSELYENNRKRTLGLLNSGISFFFPVKTPKWILYYQQPDPLS